MRELSPKHDDKEFTSEFKRGLLMAFAAATAIAISLFLLAVISYFSFTQNWM